MPATNAEIIALAVKIADHKVRSDLVRREAKHALASEAQHAALLMKRSERLDEETERLCAEMRAQCQEPIKADDVIAQLLGDDDDELNGWVDREIP